MAKKTEQDTSPVGTGEVNKEGTTTPQDTVDANNQAELEAQKQAEEKAKQQAAELEAQKQAEEKAKQQKAELEAQKKAEEKAKQEANDRLLNGYEYRGRKYNFTNNMPLKVNLDGEIFSQEEIMSNTDIIESMIDSKNIFIKEI